MNIKRVDRLLIGLILLLTVALLFWIRPSRDDLPKVHLPKIQLPKRNTPTPVPTPTPIPTHTLTTQQAIVRAQLATVAILQVTRGATAPVLGSGAIISYDGYIVTNAHVVYGKTTVGIGIFDEITDESYWAYNADVISRDQDNDIAILKIVTDDRGKRIATSPLPVYPIRFGDTQLIMGDEIYVLGYPSVGGATLTLSRGLVSGFWTDDYGRRWIKTDAEMSPGSSGGVAITVNGEFAGIPTAIDYWYGGAGKLGYLIPGDKVREYAERYVELPAGPSTPIARSAHPPTSTPRLAPPPTSTPRLSSPPAPLYVQVEVTVPAKPPWYNTGVRVESGDIVTIDYLRGQWSAWTTTEDGGRMIGPEGYTMSSGWSNPTYTMPTTNPMSLIARIGSGPPFHIGSHKRFAASSSGVLVIVQGVEGELHPRITASPGSRDGAGRPQLTALQASVR